MLKSDASGLYQVPIEYEAFLGAENDDLSHYAALAARLGGPVLDLATGTGRVALHLASQGLWVHGLDNSEPMLALARQRASERALDVQWVQADLRDFDLGQSFALALLPYNGLQHLHTSDAITAFFTCLNRHLPTGAHFALDVHLPQPLLLARDPDEWFGVEMGPQLPDGPSVLAERTAYDGLSQVLTQTWALSDGQGGRIERSLALRQFFPQELEALLLAHGWRILERQGSFGTQALKGPILKQILLAVRI